MRSASFSTTCHKHWMTIAKDSWALHRRQPLIPNRTPAHLHRCAAALTEGTCTLLSSCRLSLPSALPRLCTWHSATIHEWERMTSSTMQTCTRVFWRAHTSRLVVGKDYCCLLLLVFAQHLIYCTWGRHIFSLGKFCFPAQTVPPYAFTQQLDNTHSLHNTKHSNAYLIIPCFIARCGKKEFLSFRHRLLPFLLHLSGSYVIIN